MKPLDKSLIVLGVLFAILAAQRLHALSCMPVPNEAAQLELESVEVDGEPQADLSAYEGYDAELIVMYDPGDLRFSVETEDPDNHSYLHRSYRAALPDEDGR